MQSIDLGSFFRQVKYWAKNSRKLTKTSQCCQFSWNRDIGKVPKIRNVWLFVLWFLLSGLILLFRKRLLLTVSSLSAKVTIEFRFFSGYLFITVVCQSWLLVNGHLVKWLSSRCLRDELLELTASPYESFSFLHVCLWLTVGVGSGGAVS